MAEGTPRCVGGLRLRLRPCLAGGLPLALLLLLLLPAACPVPGPVLATAPALVRDSGSSMSLCRSGCGCSIGPPESSWAGTAVATATPSAAAGAEGEAVAVLATADTAAAAGAEGEAFSVAFNALAALPLDDGCVLPRAWALLPPTTAGREEAAVGGSGVVSVAGAPGAGPVGPCFRGPDLRLFPWGAPGCTSASCACGCSSA